MAYTQNFGSLNGNSFGNKSWSVGKGERVWREIRHRYPAGGKIVNLTAFADSTDSSMAKVPAGTPVTFNAATKEITLLTSSALGGSDVKVDGFTQDEIVCSKTDVATATVVYSGEIYAYMFASADLAKLKTLAPAEIHFVQ